MGYYTDYTIEITDESSDMCTKDHIRNISELSGFFLVEPCTWNNHENNLIKYSKKHPKTIFKLTGVEDAPGDLWVKYFKNGVLRTGHAKITYPTFNKDTFQFDNHLIDKE